MSHVEIADGLDVIVAERYMKPRVDTALDMLRDAARTWAPATRTWVTMRDERVRQSHADVDGQTIPDNLRFKVPKPGQPGVHELARHPRDPNLSTANAINCRCEDPSTPHLLRESIVRTPVTVIGTRVTGSVETRFPRAAESEFGTSGDTAAHFMTNALREVAARLQSGQAR